MWKYVLRAVAHILHGLCERNAEPLLPKSRETQSPLTSRVRPLASGGRFSCVSEGRTKARLLDPLVTDIGAASAAYLWDVLPEIVSAGRDEAFHRLAVHFETAIRAYFEALENWGFPPATQESAPRNIPRPS